MLSKITMNFEKNLNGNSKLLGSWIETKSDMDTLKIRKKGVS